MIVRRRAGLLAVAVGLALVPISPLAIERWYSGWFYPPLQRLLTSASNLAPFAFFDALIICGLVWGVWRVARDVAARRTKGGWGRVTLGLLVKALTASAVLYLAFLTTWGLNYRRVPLKDKVQFDPGMLVLERARELGTVAVAQANALHDSAHATPATATDTVDPSLAQAFADAQQMLGVRQLARPARPKHSLLDPYFLSAAVDGMTDPYFLETLIATDLVAVERPFVIAHEWSHLAGLADESDANFLGWLTCVHGSSEAQYSGWLFLYEEVARGLPRPDRESLTARLAPGPREDLRAIAQRIASHVRPAISGAGWQVYDRFLKANRIEAGTASYAQVVQLILGTRFSADWRPVVRGRD